MIHYPGLQNDEALFAAPLYSPAEAVFRIEILKHEIPVMDMSYIGALKTWLYAPILKVVPPSYLSIRLPVLIFGSITVGFFYYWLKSAHGRRAAWIGAVLLATDTMFLMTTCFDWGPVALQHFLTVVGMALVIGHRRRLLPLAGGFLCFGLAAWDKAVFVWIFTGLLLGVVLVYPDALKRALGWKSASVSALGFLIGAFPLIAYNVTENFPTFHAASSFTTRDLYAKARFADGTWRGEGLFRYMVNEDDAPNPRGPRTLVDKASFGLRAWAGEHRTNGLNWAGLAALALLPPSMWWPRARRPALFCLVVMGVAWLQMAVTQGAGAAVHHVVLLWPFPHALMAVLFAEASQRLAGVGWIRVADWLIGAIMTTLLGLNVLVTNQYVYQFARNGAAGSWSDAVYSLSGDLNRWNSQAHGSPIAVLDWGIVTSLEVLNEGHLPLMWSSDPFKATDAGQVVAAPPPDPVLLRDPETLWLGHADGYEQFPGVNAKVRAFAEQAGLKQVRLRTYLDTNGRSIFYSFGLSKNRTAETR
ncbi:MAG: hypothetical protein ABJB49_09105 [Nitrospirota bacterium]